MRSLTLALIIGCGLVALGAPAAAQPPPVRDTSLPMRAYVPSTISPQASAIYAGYRAFVMQPTPPIPTTAAGFEALYQANEPRSLIVAATAAKTYGSAADHGGIGRGA